MKVINLFGGPGTGKSSVAAGLFHLMKFDNIKVELVREFAKYAAWTRNQTLFDDYIYLFAKQQRQQRILRGQVDWIITDSPIILALIYARDKCSKTFIDLVMETYDSYYNINIILRREKRYAIEGRTQTEEEAIEIDSQMRVFIDEQCIDYTRVIGNKRAAISIYNLLKIHHGVSK